jgi:ribosome-associated translation inhibitor RaiA
MSTAETSPPTIDIRTRGAVTNGQREYAIEKLRAAWKPTPRPVLHASIELALESNPALERPAVAKASVDVSGQVLRAHVADASLENAIGAACDRINRSIRKLAERRQTEVRRGPSSGEGEWRHGDRPTDRPEFFPRPVEDRQLVRHKTYSVLSMTPEEAAFEMDMLGYDFHLYVDAGTGADCLIARRDDGELELVSLDSRVGTGPAGEPVELPVRTVAQMDRDDAVRMLDASEVHFVAFGRQPDDRLQVVYRRYDGHYGLLAPADA